MDNIMVHHDRPMVVYGVPLTCMEMERSIIKVHDD